MHDPKMEERATAEQKLASEHCIAVSTYLRSLGYHFIAITISKFIRGIGDACTPGATILDADRRMTSTYPHQARILRQMADQLEESWRKSGVAESIDGYSEEVAVPPELGVRLQ